jgi:hypothetical protein
MMVAQVKESRADWVAYPSFVNSICPSNLPSINSRLKIQNRDSILQSSVIMIEPHGEVAEWSKAADC